MKTNLHIIDRFIRVVGGLGLTSLAFWGPHNTWFLLGLIFVVTGLWGFCPLYRLIGFKTK